MVGTQELSEGGDPTKTTAGYFLAKVAQETLIVASSIPYSIVHATQFFEFIKSIADASTIGGVVRLPPVLFQPMAALPVQIYTYARSPYPDWQVKAWGAALILITLIGALSLLSRWAVTRKLGR